MADIKVVYFDLRGRGELIRLVLHAAGVPFTDERVQFADWPGMKATTPSPSGMLPYIEYNGKVYAESQAISRFLAKKYGLAGKTEEEILLIDGATCMTEDVRNTVYEYKHMEDAGQSNVAKLAFAKTKGPAAFDKLEQMLAKNRTGFFVGSSVSTADLNMNDVCDLVDKEIPSLLSKYKCIATMRQKVTSIPSIAAYLKTRKQTDM